MRLPMRAVTACIVVLMPWVARAQTDAAPSALECMQVAMADTAQAPAPVVARRNAPVRAAPVASACWIDYPNVEAWADGSPTFVDVRSPATIQSYRLAGVLEIALSDLPRKAFLKQQSIVLIGSGFDDADLAQACEVLHADGFSKVKLLRGGVRTWQQAGRAAVRAGADFAPDSIAPAAFHRGVSDAPWLVLGVGLPPSDGLPKLARMRAVDGKDGIAVIAQARSELAQMPEEKRPSLIVVVAQDAASLRELREAARRARVADIVFLEGGLAAYRQFLTEQESIAANAGKPLVRPCGTT